jgi:thiol:disulfide interchange protein DsbA
MNSFACYGSDPNLPQGVFPVLEKYMRHLILSAFLAGASFFAIPAQAADIEEGKQYVALEPAVPVSAPGKIEVVEMFWYGCSHCYQFESTINPWIEQLPDDVHFIRVPAMFGGLWNAHGQMFIALESMGVEHSVHAAVFDAIHKGGQKLATPDEMAAFLATQGVDQEAFLKAYNSFGVKAQVEKAKKLAAAYQISGVPVMIVNGKYRFDIGSSGGPTQALDVADQLIDKERAAE